MAGVGCSDDAMCWNLIGLVGRGGSGKDTAAQGLLKDHRWVRVALSDSSVQQMRQTVERYWQEGKRVVITGVRFEDEADAIIELGGLLVFVDRPGLDTSDGHSSETGVDAIVAKYRAPDMLVRLENNLSVEALQERLCALVA